jgi:hypothetical protein
VGKPFRVEGLSDVLDVERRMHDRILGDRLPYSEELPEEAWFIEESTWVVCNLATKRVDLSTAPSLAAVNLLSALKKDDKLRRVFWVSHIKQRLTCPYD